MLSVVTSLIWISLFSVTASRKKISTVTVSNKPLTFSELNLTRSCLPNLLWISVSKRQIMQNDLWQTFLSNWLPYLWINFCEHSDFTVNTRNGCGSERLTAKTEQLNQLLSGTLLQTSSMCHIFFSSLLVRFQHSRSLSHSPRFATLDLHSSISWAFRLWPYYYFISRRA